MRETHANEGDESSREQPNGAGPTRRRYLRSTVGAGVLAAGAGVAFGPGVASGAEVTSVTFEKLSVIPEEEAHKATVAYDSGVVTVTGQILGSDACNLVELLDVRVESDTLIVPVEARPDPAAFCQQVLTAYPYEVTVELSGEVSSVVVEHQSSETWQREITIGGSTGPGVPTNVTTTELTSSSFSLAWDAPTETGAGIDHYELQVFWTDVGTFLTTTGTSVTIDDSSGVGSLTPGTTYYVQVRAIDVAGNASEWSPEVSGTIPQPDDSEAPTAPTNLVVTILGSSRVDLTWDPSTDSGGSGLSHYLVTVSDLDNSEIATEQQVAADSTSTTIGGLTPETTYAFHVSAVDGTGNTSSLATVEATTDAGEPSLPEVAGNVPRDLDGDGTFEDLNGNDRIDNDDVVTYFEYMDSPEMTDHPAAYDYNGNGRIDFDDVVTLFERL